MLILKGKSHNKKKQYKGYLTGKDLEQIIISLHSWNINHDKKYLIALEHLRGYSYHSRTRV